MLSQAEYGGFIMTKWIVSFKHFIALILLYIVLLISNVAIAGKKIEDKNEIITFIFGSLFPSGIKSIDPDKIKQGKIGDCQAISAISSLARSEQGRNLILNYFSYEGTEYIKVNLPGSVEPITVSIFDVKDNEIYATSTDGGLWLPVLEKALAIYTRKFGEGPVCDADDNYTLFIKSLSLEYLYDDYVLDAIDGTFIIKILTGSESNSLDIDDLDFEALHRHLITFTEKSEILTAGVFCNLSEYNIEGDVNNISELLTSCHQYSILGYDRYKRTVKIRNPYGEGELLNVKSGQPIDQVNDGVFYLNLKDFKKLFDFLSYSKPLSDYP